MKPQDGECLQCVKEVTNEAEENDVALVRTNSHVMGGWKSQ